MKLGIIGLGYIGTVMSSVLAENGHYVLGVDINVQKIDMIKNCSSPIKEPKLNDIINKVVKSGNLYVTTNLEEVINSTQVSFICVGTPQKQDGDLDVSAVIHVCLEIAEIISTNKIQNYNIFIRSTLKPGTVQHIWNEINNKYDISNVLTINLNPEFIREGNAVYDFYNPPYTVVALQNSKTKSMIEDIYKFLDTKIYYTNINVAEIIKYVNNTFHALKVVFANEIASICTAYNIDAHEVMKLFSMDKVLNISDYYLKPGFAYGGSCLPKDLSGINKIANNKNINIPLINSISLSNTKQIDKLKEKLLEFNVESFGFIGVAFKNDTDDLRNSPVVEIVEFLLGKGKVVNIYDPEVEFAFLTGGNLAYLKKHFNHFEKLLVKDIEKLIDNSEVIVLHKKANSDLAKLKDKIIVDLNYQPEFVHYDKYYGINW